MSEPDRAKSRSVNLAHWDERAPAHAASPGYSVDRFVADPAHLSHVVRFDVPRLRDISGLRGLHLQCHIGTDTISLARLGATMTGLDFSSASLAAARDIAARAHADVRYVHADVENAVEALAGEQFDLVFTGIGALCWLPDIAAWATTVAELLAPGGRLFLREGHPMLWALDDADTPGLRVEYPYFETPDAAVFDEPGSYVETDATLHNTVSHSWNHGLGEIVTALLDNGLALTQLVEHDTVPWEALPGQMELEGSGEWHLRDRPARLPLTYTLQAVKTA